ncbi:C2HC-type zinc finger protein, partial [Klebsiella pneumoniae]|uniref:C2HC-type zinc finger protein n=1 Tax=Klebsiella pneumoniae TaxID=573 RepID=UPI00117B2E63
MNEYEESELVKQITMGLTVEDRCRLVFMGEPKTMQDLDQLCIQGNNIKYLDKQREEFQNTSRNKNIVRYDKKGTNNAVLNNQRLNVKCFNCGKVGHLARSCWYKNTET